MAGPESRCLFKLASIVATLGGGEHLVKFENYTGLLGGQVVKALDCRPRGPRFQPHYSNRDFFHLGVYSALPKKSE